RDNLEGASIVLTIRVAENVNRIVMTPVGGQELIEPPQALRGKLGQFSVIRHQRIGGYDSRSARVGHDGKPWPPRAGLFAENLRHVEKVGDIVDAQHARAAESCFQHLVAASERPRMKGSGA